MGAELARLLSCVEYCGELRAPHRCHHPRRTHRSGAHAHLDDRGARLDQVLDALRRDDVPGDDRDVESRIGTDSRMSIIFSW